MLSSSLSRRLLTPLRACESRISSTLFKNNSIPSCSVINSNNLTATRFLSSNELPYHLVVGMPALSPTMESGAIASWNVEVGDSITAGDTIAEIETDKATITFEAQDDAYIAKILVEDGTTDIVVGDPIMVTVEDEEHVGAFKDYVPPEAIDTKEATPPPAAIAAVETPAPPPKVETPATPPSPVVAATPSPPLPSPVPETVVATTMAPVWGEPVKVMSPLVGRLSTIQKEYVELYGSTGQLPIE